MGVRAFLWQTAVTVPHGAACGCTGFRGLRGRKVQTCSHCPRGPRRTSGPAVGGGTCWAGAEGSVAGTWCHGVVGLSHAHPRPRCGGVAAGREGPSTQTAAPRGRQAAGAGLSLTPMGARCSHGGGGVGVTEAVMTAQDNSQRFWRFHGIDGDLGSALV